MFKNEFSLFCGTNLRKYVIMRPVVYPFAWVISGCAGKKVHIFWKINWLIVHENKTSEWQENEKERWKLLLEIRNIKKLRKQLS